MLSANFNSFMSLHFGARKNTLTTQNIHRTHLDKLPVDLKKPIFDSLKADYGKDFPDWFQRAQNKGRPAFVVYKKPRKGEPRDLKAFLVFKKENPEQITTDGKKFKGKALKISAMKVGEELRGKGIGKGLIERAKKAAGFNGIQNMYVTFRKAKEQALGPFFEKFGFKKVGDYFSDPRDLVYAKTKEF